MNPFNTSSSYFTNEAIIAGIGGNVKAWLEDEQQDQEDENANEEQ